MESRHASYSGLEEPPRGCVTIFVRVSSDKTVVVPATTSEQVRAVKARALSKAAGAGPGAGSQGARARRRRPMRERDCYLRLASKPMRDEASVGSYARAGDHHVNAFLCGRRRGGCFLVSFTILCTCCMAAVLSVCTCGASLVVIPFLFPLLLILPFFCL